jgi:hypothetical protein
LLFGSLRVGIVTILDEDWVRNACEGTALIWLQMCMDEGKVETRKVRKRRGGTGVIFYVLVQTCFQRCSNRFKSVWTEILLVLIAC